MSSFGATSFPNCVEISPPPRPIPSSVNPILAQRSDAKDTGISGQKTHRGRCAICNHCNFSALTIILGRCVSPLFLVFPNYNTIANYSLQERRRGRRFHAKRCKWCLQRGIIFILLETALLPIRCNYRRLQWAWHSFSLSPNMFAFCTGNCTRNFRDLHLIECERESINIVLTNIWGPPFRHRRVGFMA